MTWLCCLTWFLLLQDLPLPAQGIFRQHVSRLDAFRNEKLYQSESALCAEVMTLSAQESDWPSYVQAWGRQIETDLLHSREPEDYATVITGIRERATGLPGAIQPFANLLQGDVYMSYLMLGNYRIRRRTPVPLLSASDGDLETWTLPNVRDTIVGCYAEALRGLGKDAGLPAAISAWSVLCADDRTTGIQPATLFDLFAFHMLNNHEYIGDVTRLDTLCLLDADAFTACDFSATPDAGRRFYLQTLQELERRHRQDPAVLSMLRYALLDFSTAYSTRLTFEQLDDFYAAVRPYPAAKYVLLKIAGLCRNDRRWKRESHYLEQLMNTFPGDTLARLAAIRHDELCLQSNLRLDFLSDDASSGLIPDEPVKARLSFSNTDSVFFALYRLPVHYASCLPIEVNDSCLQAMKPFRTWRMDLPAHKIYTTSTADCLIEGMPSGMYVLAYSNVPLNRTDYPYRTVGMECLEVSGLKALYNRTAGSCGTLYIVNRKTGKPVRNATVHVYADVYPDKNSEGELIQRTFHSDANGLVDIQIPSQGVEDLDMLVSYKKDTLFYISNSYFPRPVTERAPGQTYVTYLNPDRTIYRPGQTMQFSGLVTMHDGQELNRVAADRKVEITLRGPDGREIDTLTCITNSWGSFNGTFQLPASGLTGMYTLRCGNSMSSISVEAYRRPSFTVQMDTPDKAYVFGDTIRMEGMVQTYAGYPVSDAEVSYDIYQNFSGYDIFVTDSVCQTDAHGRFVLSFTVDVPKQMTAEEKTSRIEASLTITSRDGETQTHTVHTGVGRSRVLITPAWPQLLLPGMTDKVTVTTQDAQATHVPARLTVTVRSLVLPGQAVFRSAWSRRSDSGTDFPMPREVHNRHFPWLADDLGIYDTGSLCDSLPAGRTAFVWEGQTEDAAPVTLPQLATLKNGWYEAEMNAVAADGSTDRRILRFRVISEKPSMPVTLMDDWFTAVRTEAEPDGYYEFQVAGAFRSNYVLMEYQKKDTLLTRTIKVGRTPEIIRIPADANSDGAEVRFTMINRNRVLTESRILRLQQPERELQLEIATFRDLVQPGSAEAWTLTVRGHDGQPIPSELTATLYDASLDALRPHHWDTILRIPTQFHYIQGMWGTMYPTNIQIYPIMHYSMISSPYPFSLPGFNLLYRLLNQPGLLEERDLKTAVPRFAAKSANASGAIMRLEEPDMEESIMLDQVFTDEESMQPQSGIGDNKSGTRTDFSETAYFLPPSVTDEDGSLRVSFTMPDALTRWHLMVFAHTKDLHHGYLEKWLVTQNPVAIEARPPRIFRTGDTLTFTTRLSSTLEEARPGTATLELFDAVSDQPLPCLITARGAQAAVSLQVQAQPGQTVPVNWSVAVPKDVTAIRYRLTFKCEGYADGEEKVLPVLSNQILITESVPMYIPAHTTKGYTLQSLVKTLSDNPDIQPQRLSFEVAADPIWYVVQALPYLMESDPERADGVFTRLFANSIAGAIVQEQPAIRTVLAQWRQDGASGRMTTSPLTADPDLKQVLLDETPWVMDARDETERLNRMTALFDTGRMVTEQYAALAKLQQMQQREGSFSWFPGLPSADLRITLHIASGLARLLREQLIDDSCIDMAHDILHRTCMWLDNYFTESFQTLQKEGQLSDHQPGIQAIEYLYTLTLCDISTHEMTEAAQYLLQQAAARWNRYDLQPLGMLALALHRTGDTATAARIARSVAERSVQRSPELGAFWPKLKAGRFWYENPVVTVSQYFEMFNEITPDAAITDAIRTWLLRQRQTINWETCRATAAACWMLLHDRRFTGSPTASPLMTAGGKALTPQTGTAGTGWFRVDTPADRITPDMGQVTVKNTGNQAMWGAIYWQYLTSSPDVEPAAGDCSVKRQYFVVRQTSDGTSMDPIDAGRPLTTGDQVRVRLVLHAEQDMEYVHVKDGRPAGFEPVSTFSQSGCQDGLWYYKSIRDAAVNFFISYMPRGSYVLEYDLQAAHPGQFSTGPATLQCFYAPQFSAHSDGAAVRIRQDE